MNAWDRAYERDVIAAWDAIEFEYIDVAHWRDVAPPEVTFDVTAILADIEREDDSDKRFELAQSIVDEYERLLREWEGLFGDLLDEASLVLDSEALRRVLPPRPAA